MIDTNGKPLHRYDSNNAVEHSGLDVMYNASRPINFEKHNFSMFVGNVTVAIYTRNSHYITDDNVIYYGINESNTLKIMPHQIDMDVVVLQIKPQNSGYYPNMPISIDEPVRLVIDGDSCTVVYNHLELSVVKILKFEKYFNGSVPLVSY